MATISYKCFENGNGQDSLRFTTNQPTMALAVLTAREERLSLIFQANSHAVKQASTHCLDT